MDYCTRRGATVALYVYGKCVLSFLVGVEVHKTNFRVITDGRGADDFTTQVPGRFVLKLHDRQHRDRGIVIVSGNWMLKKRCQQIHTTE
jgi:hypothetical protein